MDFSIKREATIRVAAFAFCQIGSKNRRKMGSLFYKSLTKRRKVHISHIDSTYDIMTAKQTIYAIFSFR
jgi:hypothetical protein